MRKDNPMLSSITPAYNRGTLLKKCYESLLLQSDVDFEWIVVDDGSTDNTPQIMMDIERGEQTFRVCFIRKENGGKHTALNASHSYIRGKYVLILDSDDYLTPDAVKTVLSGWRAFENNPKVGIVAFEKQTPDGQICAYAKGEYVPISMLRYKRICVVSGDSCEVIRADLFKKYPFPVFEGERFLAETALWYRAGLEAACVYINKPVYVCEYLEGGLTRQGRKMRIRNPKGGMYTSFLRMNRRCRLQERIRAGLLYVCYGRFAGERTWAMVKRTWPYSWMTILCMIPGTIMYCIWKKQYLNSGS